MVNELLLVPTGVVVTPDAPSYHWYANGPLPPATTLNVALEPLVMVVDAGCVAIDGGAQTVTVAVVLLTLPQLFETRTQ